MRGPGHGSHIVFDTPQRLLGPVVRSTPAIEAGAEPSQHAEGRQGGRLEVFYPEAGEAVTVLETTVSAGGSQHRG
jgi:hypothetical protein